MSKRKQTETMTCADFEKMPHNELLAWWLFDKLDRYGGLIPPDVIAEWIGEFNGMNTFAVIQVLHGIEFSKPR